MILRFREIDRDGFNDIKTGKKKVETRAATKKYVGIKAGDMVKIVCGKDSVEKKVKKVTIFKSIPDMLKKYKPNKINSKTETKEELEKMYHSFPDYKEKIKEHGIIAMEL